MNVLFVTNDYLLNAATIGALVQSPQLYCHPLTKRSKAGQLSPALCIVKTREQK